MKRQVVIKCNTVSGIDSKYKTHVNDAASRTCSCISSTAGGLRNGCPAHLCTDVLLVLICAVRPWALYGLIALQPYLMCNFGISPRANMYNGHKVKLATLSVLHQQCQT